MVTSRAWPSDVITEINAVMENQTALMDRTKMIASL